MRGLALGCLLLSSACAHRGGLSRAEDLREKDSPALRRAAASPRASRRKAALRAMGRIQDAGALPELSRALSDREASVRAEAAFDLGQLALSEEPWRGPSAEAAERALSPLIASDDGAATLAAVEALGKTGGPRAEEILVRALQDPDARLRGEAALALFRLRYLKRVPDYSTASVRGLTALFKDPDAEVRWRAVYAFTRWPEPRAEAGLKAAAADADLWTRFFALRALGQLKGGAPVEPLVVALGDSEPWVRLEAVKALGQAGRAELIGEELARDPSAHVRAALADALAASGKGELAGRLSPLAEESSTLVRGQALLAQAKLLGAGARERLDKERTFPHWWIKSRAYLALGDVPGAEAALKEGLSDPDPRVAAAALEGLAKSAAPAAEAALDAVLRGPQSPLEVREAAVAAAAERKSPALLGALKAALDNSRGREFGALRPDIIKAFNETVAAHQELPQEWIDELKEPGQPSPWLGAKPEPASVLLVTERGEIELELAAAEAPIHSASFLQSVRAGFYDGLGWHRVVSGFVIQGGDPRGSGSGDAGFSLRDEINPLRFLRGTLGMPKAGKDTGGCQLFITHVPTPHLDGRYTAFGRVTRGMDVVDRLEPGDKILRARVLPAVKPARGPAPVHP